MNGSNPLGNYMPPTLNIFVMLITQVSWPWVVTGVLQQGAFLPLLPTLRHHSRCRVLLHQDVVVGGNSLQCLWRTRLLTKDTFVDARSLLELLRCEWRARGQLCREACQTFPFQESSPT